MKRGILITISITVILLLINLSIISAEISPKPAAATPAATPAPAEPKTGNTLFAKSQAASPQTNTQSKSTTYSNKPSTVNLKESDIVQSGTKYYLYESGKLGLCTDNSCNFADLENGASPEKVDLGDSVKIIRPDSTNYYTKGGDNNYYAPGTVETSTSKDASGKTITSYRYIDQSGQYKAATAGTLVAPGAYLDDKGNLYTYDSKTAQWKDKDGNPADGKTFTDKDGIKQMLGDQGKLYTQNELGQWCITGIVPCASGYYEPCEKGSDCVGGVCKDLGYGSDVCTNKQDAATYDIYSHDITFRISEAMNWAAYGTSMSNLFFGEEAWAGWRKNMDEFFESSVLGQVVSGNWEESICQVSFDVDNSQTVMLESKGMATFGMHIEGEVIGPGTYMENGTTTTEYLYKVSFYLKNSNNDSNRYNIAFDSEDKHVFYYSSAKEIAGGGSVQGTSSNMIVAYSTTEYYRVCLVLEHSIEDYQGEKRSTVCNAISGYSGEASGYGSTGSWSSGSGGTDPEVNSNF